MVMQSGNNHIKVNSNKYLVPNEMKFGAFIQKVREYVTFDKTVIPDRQALFLLVGDRQILISPTHTMADVYKAHASDDGMLYVWVTTENTFG